MGQIFENVNSRKKQTQIEAPPACSKAWASCRMRDSPKAGPKSCSPTGSSPQILPHGTEIPGTPASEPVTVYISARYICSGSLVRSPSLNAGTGEVGVFKLGERTSDPLVRSPSLNAGTGEVGVTIASTFVNA